MSKILRFALDAVLVSTVLAGARRAAGLEVNTRKIENKTLKDAIDGYLWIGDYALDFTISGLKRFPDWVTSAKQGK
jgi:hypothetical protein